MRRHTLWIGIAALLTGVGCSMTSSSPPLSVDTVGALPAGASLASAAATVPAGTVFELVVQPSHDGDAVSLAIDDAAVAMVAPSTTKSQFVVAGLAAGTTTMHVVVNGQPLNAFVVNGATVSSIPVAVSGQPAPM